MAKVQSLQDPFLNALRKEHIVVSIYLVNGIKLQGQVESFDQFVVLLKNQVSQMVYKHAISTIVLPSSLSKWAILSGSIVPVAMNAGLSPEFSQIIFRYGECMTIGLTPLFAYFVIYLAYLEKYNQKSRPLSLFETLKYQIPYSLLSGLVLLIIIIVWYIIGLPIGFGATPVI